MKISALRKLLNQGLFSVFGDGWKILPLHSNCYAVEFPDGRVILSDGDEHKEFPSLADALEKTTFVERKKFAALPQS